MKHTASKLIALRLLPNDMEDDGDEQSGHDDAFFRNETSISTRRSVSFLISFLKVVFSIFNWEFSFFKDSTSSFCFIRELVADCLLRSLRASLLERWELSSAFTLLKVEEIELSGKLMAEIRFESEDDILLERIVALSR